MISVSTSWCSEQARDGDDLLRALEQVGADAVELEYRITSPLWNEAYPAFKERRFTVSSIHNYFPLPTEFGLERASGDLFNLASEDGDVRDRGVELTVRTMEQANDLEVERVVLHCGYLENMVPLSNELRAVVEKGDAKAKGVLAELLEDRARKGRRGMDRLKFSLEKLLGKAERLGVRLGLENRDWIRQLPDIEEMGTLLDLFDGAPVGFWFDVGHGVKFERYGICAARDWLERFGKRLLGVHVHDVEHFKDHLPPGKGDVDLAALFAGVDGSFTRVVEILPGTSAGDVREGIEVTRELFRVKVPTGGSRKQ